MGDEARLRASLDLIATLIPGDVVLPAQTLGELYRVLTAKAKASSGDRAGGGPGVVGCLCLADSTWTALQSALDLAGAHRLQIWDALILSVAAECRCRLLLTEDLQPGFVWRGVTVVNPYTAPAHPLLQHVARK